MGGECVLFHADGREREGYPAAGSSSCPTLRDCQLDCARFSQRPPGPRRDT